MLRRLKVFSYRSFLENSSCAVALLVSSLMSAKNLRKFWVSFSSIYSEQTRPSCLISLKLAKRSISLSFFSSNICTRNISRFFLIRSQRFSRFFGRSTGTLKPAASAMLILSVMSGLIARAAGSMSVSQSFRRQPSRVGLFFSQILSFLLTWRSRSLRVRSSSLKVKMRSSPGSLKGLVCYSKPS